MLTAASGDFADRADVVIACGVPNGADLVTAHALRCVCRVAEDLTAGSVDSLAELERAVATVPVEYPWRSQLRAAVEAARLIPT